MNSEGIVVKIFTLGVAGALIGLGLAIANHNNGLVFLGGGFGMFMGFLFSYLDGDFITSKERRRLALE